MRALSIEGPNRVVITDIHSPIQKDDEVLIDVLAGGICGTDVEILQGTMEYFTNGLASYPVIPCHEWMGVVHSIGPKVRKTLLPGDHVVGECSIGCLTCPVCLSGNYHRCRDRTETGILNRSGAFAEQISLPAAFVHRIAPHVPIRTAALVEPATVAYSGVKRACVTPGDRVAIFGDGPIGLLLLQSARLFGAYRVILIGAADRRLEVARELGADLVIDARSENIRDRLEAFGEDEWPDVIFEASGNPKAMKTALSIARPGGRIVLQSFCSGKRIDQINFDRLVADDITIIGAQGSPGVWPEVIRLIEDGRLDPGALVSDELPVSAFVEAIRRVVTRDAVKVILRADLPNAWRMT